MAKAEKKTKTTFCVYVEYKGFNPDLDKKIRKAAGANNLECSNQFRAVRQMGKLTIPI